MRQNCSSRPEVTGGTALSDADYLNRLYEFCSAKLVPLSHSIDFYIETYCELGRERRFAPKFTHQNFKRGNFEIELFFAPRRRSYLRRVWERRAIIAKIHRLKGGCHYRLYSMHTVFSLVKYYRLLRLKYLVGDFH